MFLKCIYRYMDLKSHIQWKSQVSKIGFMTFLSTLKELKIFKII